LGFAISAPTYDFSFATPTSRERLGERRNLTTSIPSLTPPLAKWRELKEI